MQLDAEAIPDDIPDFLADIDDAEIALSGDIDAEIKDRTGIDAQVVQEFFEGHKAEVAVFAGGDHGVSDERGGLVGRDATIFLFPLLFIDAFGVLTSDPLFARIVSTGGCIDFFDETLGDCCLKRDFEERPPHGVAALLDVADELVEKCIDAAMGGNDRERAAPLDDGFSNCIESALFFVQGKLVQLHVAALADDSVGI